jgi:hypothetical protein
MSSNPSRKFISRSNPDQDFKSRLKEALRRRLHPNTGLHSDQLAGVLGLHGDTVRGWLRGSNAVSGPMLSELMRFFYSAGDHDFAVEMFGDAITPLAGHAKAQALKALDEARQALIGGAE